MQRPPQPSAGPVPEGRPGRQRTWLTAFGARIALDGEIEPLADDLVAALPGARLGSPGRRSRPDVVYHFGPTGADGASSVGRAGIEILHGPAEDILVGAIDALHFDVAQHAREASFLHASVVRWRGRLIVFPGRTGSGKSSLAAYLTGRGATYFSDEYAPIDGEGRILPYAKPISLRPDVRQRFAGPPAEPNGGGPEVAQAIVFTRFEPSARCRLQPLSFESAALSLIDNSVAAVPRPRRAAAAVARLLAHRPRLGHGPRGEAEEFADALGRWLASEP